MTYDAYTPSKSQIVVPPVAPDLPAEHGDSAGATSLTTGLSGAASRIETFAGFTDSAGTLDGWEGGAAADYGDAVTMAGTDAAPAAVALQAGADAVGAYATTLADLALRRTDIAEDRQSYASNRADLSDARDAVAETDTTGILNLIDRAREVSGAYFDLVDAIDTWESDAEAADTTLTEVLGTYGSVGAVNELSVAQALALAGAPQPYVAGDPAENAAWWQSLTPAQRAAMLAAHPEVIGNLDGLPADVRDNANRAVLAATIADLERRECLVDGLSDEERKALANARATHEALESDYVDPITGEVIPMLLHVFKPDAHGGDGGVAISLGNPDEVDHLAISVPGVNNAMTDVGDGVGNAYNLLHASRTSGSSGSVGVMFWLDYNSPSHMRDPWWESDPDFIGTASGDAAAQGATRLNAMVDGLRSANTGHQPLITAIGHSYGSVVTSQAGATGLAVDQHVLIGSPGPGSRNGIDHASDLGVSASNVYVGTASGDTVADISDGWPHGPDVTTEDFGANRFHAESVNRDDNTDEANHNRYFETAYTDGDPTAGATYSESVTTMAEIVIGNGQDPSVADAAYESSENVGPETDPEHDHEPLVRVWAPDLDS